MKISKIGHTLKLKYTFFWWDYLLDGLHIFCCHSFHGRTLDSSPVLFYKHWLWIKTSYNPTSNHQNSPFNKLTVHCEHPDKPCVLRLEQSLWMKSKCSQLRHLYQQYKMKTGYFPNIFRHHPTKKREILTCFRDFSIAIHLLKVTTS